MHSKGCAQGMISRRSGLKQFLQICINVNGMDQFNKPISKNLIETILIVLLFLGLLYALYQVLEAFFGVLTFALVFAVSFSKPYQQLTKLLHGKRKIAGIIYSVLLITIIALPFIYLISALTHHI